jgi:MFS family permease
VDVLPATLAVGLGAGIGFNPILLAAMSGVAPTEAGLASGVVNTAFMMGGALGLAVLASVAASRTDSLEASGESAVDALNGGYHLAYVLGAVFVVASAVVAALLLRPETAASAVAHGHGEPAVETG